MKKNKVPANEKENTKLIQNPRKNIKRKAKGEDDEIYNNDSGADDDKNEYFIFEELEKNISGKN